MAQRSAWLCVLALSSTLAAQSVLQPGEAAVVTTDGLWLVRPLTGEIAVAAAASFGGLTDPAVEWRPGTDELLVCNADHLFRVTVQLGSMVSIADITPAGVAGAHFTDLEVHPVTGELLLLDSGQSQLLRYAPPFAAGMAPDLVLPVAPGAQALAVDGRSWPPQVVVSDSGSIDLYGLQGGASEFMALGLDALDMERQAPAYIAGVRTGINSVLLVINDHAGVEVNMLASLCKPVVLRPVDVEFDSALDMCFVLAQKGMGPCMPGYTGKNHVVGLPGGQTFSAFPIVLTGSDSTITGVAGDLSMVWHDQSFAGSYGSKLGSTPIRLLVKGNPIPGHPDFALDVKDAAPGAPVMLLVGAPIDALVGSGQAVLVAASLSMFAGVTDGDGRLHLEAALPAGVPLGLDIWLQAVVFAGGKSLSNGLYLRIAGP